MKLSRRKAMGAVAGGAVAGPSVMKYAAEQAQAAQQMYNPRPGNQFGTAQYDGPSELKQPSLADQENNLKHLQDIASGNFPDGYFKHTNEHYSQYSRDCNLTSLKSLSNAGRSMIKHQKIIDAQKKDAIKSALERIPYVKEIISKLNPFGVKL